MAEPSKTLFGFDRDNPIIPIPDRVDPPVWIRRLVVLEELKLDPVVIRDVEFRRGLNVIATADRPSDETRIVSHSVGKTLLLRMIRYCLGESHFGRAKIVSDVERAFKGAHVVAEVTVSEVNWVVVRPLKNGTPSESFAVVADDWRRGLASSDRKDYAEFITAIEQRVFSRLPEFRLPRANRAPHWRDVLGWLARDNECKYLHHNVWRDDEANSGSPVLDRGDAALLMSWVTGVLDTAQINEIAHRRGLLRQFKQAKNELTKLRHRAEALEPILTLSLELSPEALDAGGMFADLARNKIDSVKLGYEIALESLDRDDTPGGLQDQMNEARVAVRSAEAQIRDARNWLEQGSKEKRVKQPVTEDPDADFNPDLCPLWRQEQCHHNRPTSGPLNNPNFEAEIARIREREVNEKRRLIEQEASLPILRHRESVAREEFETARRNRNHEYATLQRSLGRWRLIEEQFESFGETKRALAKTLNRIEKLDTEIEESREKQKAAKGRRKAALQSLSTIYGHTLRFFLGENAEGKVKTPAGGLQPDPGNAVAADGDAMGFMGRVIAFDLACLAATASGVGRLPGFWMHDSPNTVELEPALYDRLYTFVLELVGSYNGRAAAFQYFVTTSGRVPANILAADCVVLTLDKRDPEKTLLRRSF